MAHLHEVRDMDTHFIIDPLNNMAITNANEARNTLQLGDHDSEVYTFELPRIIEGHDMTLCNLVEVHFINAGSDKVHNSNGVFVVEDMEIADDGNDTLLFTWTVSGDGTKYAGSLNFRIKFSCIEDGKYTYKKWSATFKGIIVADGFDNGEYIETEYADVLAAWESRLVALEHKPSGVQTVNGVAPDGEGNVVVEVPAQVQPDLSVNDESDPAFVKGRTHYVTDKLTITGEPNDTYSYSMDVPVLPGFNEGDTVTVIWDGTEYEVTAKKTSYGVYVGNYVFVEYRDIDTGHPFLWYYGNKSDGTAFSTVYARDNKTHTIQIKDKIFSVPLDKKFLPIDSIYKTDLKEAMKPLTVLVSRSSIDTSGTISGLTLDKSLDEIKKAWAENREIRWVKVNNESSTKEYFTYNASYILSNTYPFPINGFYLHRIAEEHGNIYLYKIKITDFGITGTRYKLSKA